MDHLPRIEADTGNALADLAPWHDGLGQWLITFMRLRQLRRAKVAEVTRAFPAEGAVWRPAHRNVAARHMDQPWT